MVTLTDLNPFAYKPGTVTEITELRVHPIKSCRGIVLKKSYLTKQGLDLDRRWMFASASGYKFLTIRDISELTLVDVAFASSADPSNSGGEDDLMLEVSIRGTDSRIEIPARPTEEWLKENANLETVNIWDFATDGYVYAESFSKPFSDFFKKDLRLIYKGPTPRVCIGNASPKQLGRSESMNFPDLMPVLVANEASMRELNERLRSKGVDEITIERFRPNIIVRGKDDTHGTEDLAPGPWTEDTWKTVRIITNKSPATGFASMIHGPEQVVLDVQARCARCQVPNVNPETAFKNKHEPWDTLVSYRRIDQGVKWKPCFGMLSVPRGEGELSVGMRFEVVAETDKHRFLIDG